jgi:hypothetical protein
MPNAARLVAAVSLALIAFIVSGQIMPLMPEGIDFGYFTYVNIALGVVIGWKVMGRRAGRGTTAAINNGITGVVVLVFWGLFVQGSYEMFNRAMRNRFSDPFDAVTAIFEIAMEYGLIMLVPNILATLLVGGVLAGFATEYAGKKWN